MTPLEARHLRRTLYAAAFLRALGVGLMAVLIGLYAARIGLSATQIGVILSSALCGAVLLSTEAFVLIVLAAFVGMFNVHGRDRGAIPIVEQALFPATTTDADRTRVFAWYNVLLDAGYAAGGLMAAIPTLLEAWAGLSTLEGMRIALALFCALYAAAAILYSRLPKRMPGAASVGLRHLSPQSKPIVRKISLLFFMDAFGGGFIGTALFAYFFAEQFGASAATVAILFGVGRLLSAFSHFGAAWLAKRIGLVNTMVYTHIPSSVLLFTIVAS